MRVQPDLAQALPDAVFDQVAQADAVAARVGKRRVGGTALAEFGVHLDHRANINHQHKRRAALTGWQGAGVAFGLAAGAQQAIIKAFGVTSGFEFFGLQAKRALPVAVNAPGAGGAVAMAEGDRALEHVVLLRRGMRGGHAQQRAQVDDEALRSRQLAGAHAAPAGNESPGCVSCGSVWVFHQPDGAQ
ncbi:hypothetical protein GALL_456450 [mine drainage metagenome]|uniref:Uncharacterized protein n=1 Tax=mine drainage metagenome TaxID=410659 RepID=A0A1J5Q5I6_9ZZZZ